MKQHVVIFLTEYNNSSNSISRKKVIEEIVALGASEFFDEIDFYGTREEYRSRFNGELELLKKVALEAGYTGERVQTRMFLEEALQGRHDFLLEEIDYCILQFIYLLRKTHSF